MKITFNKKYKFKKKIPKKKKIFVFRNYKSHSASRNLFLLNMKVIVKILILILHLNRNHTVRHIKL